MEFTSTIIIIVISFYYYYFIIIIIIIIIIFIFRSHTSYNLNLSKQGHRMIMSLSHAAFTSSSAIPM